MGNIQTEQNEMNLIQPYLNKYVSYLDLFSSFPKKRWISPKILDEIILDLKELHNFLNDLEIL